MFLNITSPFSSDVRLLTTVPFNFSSAVTPGWGLSASSCTVIRTDAVFWACAGRILIQISRVKMIPLSLMSATELFSTTDPHLRMLISLFLKTAIIKSEVEHPGFHCFSKPVSVEPRPSGRMSEYYSRLPRIWACAEERNSRGGLSPKLLILSWHNLAGDRRGGGLFLESARHRLQSIRGGM